MYNINTLFIMNIAEKAASYAEEKSGEVMTNAIAQAYADGYRDGYRDREDEIPIDLRDNKTEYVDLGLPSGTLWAKDYEKTEGGSELSLAYEEASHLNIPTNEQWTELRENCIWQKCSAFRNGSTRHVFECIGPNGNTIEFAPTGYNSAELCLNMTNAYFWTKGEILNNNSRTAARIQFVNRTFVDEVDCCWEALFTGYSLSVRLVKQKSIG